MKVRRNVTATGLQSDAMGAVISLTGTSVMSAGKALECGLFYESQACETVDFAYAGSPPFGTTATGEAVVFDLIAANGTSSWDGSPSTFSFTTDTTVPEARTGWLLGFGLLGLLLPTFRFLQPTV